MYFFAHGRIPICLNFTLNPSNQTSLHAATRVLSSSEDCYGTLLLTNQPLAPSYLEK